MKQRTRKRMLQRRMAQRILQCLLMRNMDLPEDFGWRVRMNVIGVNSVAPFMPFEVVRRRTDGGLKVLRGPTGKQRRFKTEVGARNAISALPC